MSSVLILDDRDADRSLLATLLGYAGYEVREATSGEQALALARDERPDLVVSDLLMPGMNGYEFVRRLRGEPAIADTPVIFTTANYVEGEVRRLADACGVRHFIEKPSEPEEVLQTVGQALGTSATTPLRPDPQEFDREQLRVLNDKLVEKVSELERVNSERQRLIVRLLHAQEEERREIASAIHDDPIQTVAALSIRLETLAAELGGEQHEAVERLRADVNTAIQSLRDLVFDLEPVSLRVHGLQAALRDYLQQHFGNDHRVELDFRAQSEPDETTRSLLFRVARESLANVRKHADANRVTVVVEGSDAGWRLQVSDDGKGFHVAEAIKVRPGHLGLPSMRERLQLAGGSLEISSAPGQGSRVIAYVRPLDEEAR